MFNVSLSRNGFFRSGVTRDCLNCMGKVPVDSERLTMVVIIARIVAETSFRSAYSFSNYDMQNEKYTLI